MKVSISKEKINIFLSLLSMISKVGTSTNLYFEEERLFSQGMDGSHTCVYLMNIPRDFFTYYEYNPNHTKLITINCLKNIIKQISCLAQEVVLISLDFVNEPETLNIHFFKENETDSYAEMNIQLIEENSELLEIPEQIPDVCVISNQELKQLLGIQLNNSEKITFLTEDAEEDITLIVKTSNDNYKLQHKVEKECIHSYNENTEHLNITFSSKLLLNYYKYEGNNVNTKFSFTNENPIIINHQIIGYNDVFIKIYVAPQFDNND